MYLPLGTKEMFIDDTADCRALMHNQPGMTATNSGLHNLDGMALRRCVLGHPQLEPLKLQTDSRYKIIEMVRHQDGSAVVGDFLAPGQRFVPTASSFTLGAVWSNEDLRDFVGRINSGPAGIWIRGALQSQIACDLSQSWARRQYALSHYPPLHAPHGWHQDGALGFDFLSHRGRRLPAEALLSMVTCWVAMESCGVQSPGLELVTRRLKELLTPSDLAEERVRKRFVPEEFWRPVLEPGDALLFCGDILHRTHVTPAMTKDRTSIELRFFPADNIPERLKNDHFVLLK